VHSLTTTGTGANVADITQLPQLLHGAEREIYGDQAYWNEAHRQGAEAGGIRYRINRRTNGHAARSHCVVVARRMARTCRNGLRVASSISCEPPKRIFR
jgi:IS5 family transposase